MVRASSRAYHRPMKAALVSPFLRPAPWLVVLGALAIVGVAQAATVVPVKLSAVVGPGTNITLKKGTRLVSTLKTGTYTITVTDRAKTHNFHLVGPRVNKSTAVSRVETKIWTVSLKPGTYTYLCDPHASFMKRSFNVTR